MDKIKIGNKPYLYPYPVVLVGADVDGKPNFMTIAFCGIVGHSPGMIALGSYKPHFTNRGILENRTFSVNLPSEAMLAVTDYAGIYSGKKVDKSGLFEVFYGDLKTAPMIAQCPLAMECRVHEMKELPSGHYMILGEIVETYTEERYLTDSLPDVEKMKPVVFTMFDNRYFGIGEYLGQAWGVGKDYAKEGGKDKG